MTKFSYRRLLPLFILAGIYAILLSSNVHAKENITKGSEAAVDVAAKTPEVKTTTEKDGAKDSAAKEGIVAAGTEEIKAEAGGEAEAEVAVKGAISKEAGSEAEAGTEEIKSEAGGEVIVKKQSVPLLSVEYWQVVGKEEIEARISRGEISKGSLTNITGKFGEMPLHRAMAWSSDSEVVGLLLDLFVDSEISYLDSHKNDVIHYLVGTNRNPAITKAFVEKYPSAIFKRQKTLDIPLGVAAASNDKGEIITILKEAGSEIEVRNEFGNTAFHLAALYNNSASMLFALKDSGLNALSRNPNQLTSLHLAAVNNQNPDFVRAMITAGGDILARDGKLKTALHMAVTYNPSIEVALALIKSGSQINTRDADGNSPLLLAAMHNPDPLLLYVLINSSADFLDWNKKGLDVFDITKDQYEDKSVYQYLRDCHNAIKKQRPCLPKTDNRTSQNNRIEEKVIQNTLHQNRNLLEKEILLNAMLLNLYKFPSVHLEQSPRSYINDWNNKKFALASDKKITQLELTYSEVQKNTVAILQTAALSFLKSVKNIAPENYTTKEDAYEAIESDLEDAVDNCGFYYCEVIQYFIEYKDFVNSDNILKNVDVAEIPSEKDSGNLGETSEENTELVKSLREDVIPEDPPEDKEGEKAENAGENPDENAEENPDENAGENAEAEKEPEPEADPELFSGDSTNKEEAEIEGVEIVIEGTAHLYEEDYLALLSNIYAFYHKHFRFNETYRKDFGTDPLNPVSAELLDTVFQEMFSSRGLELYQDIVRFTRFNDEIVPYMRKRADWLLTLFPETIQPEYISH